MSAQSHLFQLSKSKPQNQNAGGFRITATKKNFPHLQGMSFYKLGLNPKAIREPHWHANADELGYCLKGQVLVSMYASGNKKETFLISQGEAFFIPSGALHDVENVGNETAELILQFSNEEPEDFALSSTFGMFSDAVLGNTWGVSETVFASTKRSTNEVFIAMQDKASVVPVEAQYVTNYRYSLNQAPALISNEGGFAKVARQDVWPVLHRQALYLLHLSGIGMREPHWHPETAEMGYVQTGRGRMSILSPSGQVDTYEMNEGDLYFIPKAYPHHIENLSNDPLQILIFFDQPLPGDVGFTASVKSYSNNTLTAVLKTPENLFASLPTYYSDLFIVKKVNPLDP